MKLPKKFGKTKSNFSNCPFCGKEINPAALLRAKQKKRPKQFYVDMVNARKDRQIKKVLPLQGERK